MCFYISKKKNEKTHRIAKKNILCYKDVIINPYSHPYLPNTCTSPIMRKLYTAGMTYKLNGKLTPQILYGDIFASRIEEGFHSYTAYSMKVKRQTQCLAECYIPKGSVYYVNSDEGEYVSDAIKVVRIGRRRDLIFNKKKKRF